MFYGDIDINSSCQNVISEEAEKKTSTGNFR